MIVKIVNRSVRSRTGTSRVRLQVIAVLTSLGLLAGFAFWVTTRDGLNLLTVSRMDQAVGRPVNDLVTALQNERRDTMIALGSVRGARRPALGTLRQHSDTAAGRFERSAGDVGFGVSATLKQRIAQARQRLAGLPDLRRDIDAGVLDRGKASQGFDTLIDSAFAVLPSNAAIDDQQIAKDGRTLIALTRAKEILAREDALLAGASAAGRITPAERSQFTGLVHTQRFLHAEAAAELPPADAARYTHLVQGPTYTRVRALEDRLIRAPAASGNRPPVRADEWRAATGPLLTDLERLVLRAGDALVDRATPVALAVILRWVLAGVLGVVAVITSVVLSVRTARALTRQLEQLRAAALRLAEERLPRVVARIGHGEQVDVKAEAPPLEFGDDAIGQVGQALNTVQQTAISTAAEQAELRRGIRDILLSLARRTQVLVHRQLTLLDAMERRDISDRELEELFRIDHLATRMRRNAENLIVLSGATPARGWRRAVPMVDMVRAAVGEVEEYTRVTVLPMGTVALAGRAVGDTTHLIAELIENAVSFSPPYTVVQVGGHPVATGYAIEIEDRGLGMSDGQLAAINERIADPPEFNLSASVQLGLYVVGRLAERYDIRVSLKRSAYGGTSAVVLIPRDLVKEVGELDEEPPPEQDAGEKQRDDHAVSVAVGAPNADAAADAAAGAGTADTDLVSVREPATGAALAPPPEQGTDRRAADEPEPAAGGDAQAVEGDTSSARQPEASYTPGGLPFRVPQASLAPELRTADPLSTAHDQDTPPGRSPEEIRQIMDSYQASTKRGRADAAKTLGPDPEPPTGHESTQ